MGLKTLSEPLSHPLGKKPSLTHISPRRQRIISESTGLVKFNITKQKCEENDKANAEFEQLESNFAQDQRSRQRLSPNRSMNRIVASVQPSLAPSPQKIEEGVNLMNDDLMLELASKQREVLELKSNMEALKSRLARSERELHEIERRCNRSSPLPSQRPLRPGLRIAGTKASIQTLRASLETHSSQTNANFASLKKKISLPQISQRVKLAENSPFNQSLNNNIQKFQKDTNLIIERGLTFMNNLRNDMFREDDESSEGSESDYGEADASDYMLAVK
jgi:hypothetical protein